MTKLLGAHAIVVGAGMGGLVAAKALSAYFQKVTVLERDALPSTAEARTGTPQCRQLHVLLKGGLDALSGFFPEFEAELERAGAVRARAGSGILVESPGFDPFPQRDLDFDTLCMTRPLVEFVARSLVERQPNISVQSRCRVTRLLASADGAAVTGVRFDSANGESAELAADLVIDASSRGTLTLELLDQIGLSRPEETEIGIDLSYATATFVIPPGAHRAGMPSSIGRRPKAGAAPFCFRSKTGAGMSASTAFMGTHPPTTSLPFSHLPKRFGRQRSTMRSRMPCRLARSIGSICPAAFGDGSRDFNASRPDCFRSATRFAVSTRRTGRG